MKTLVLHDTDVKRPSDGYHLDVWEMLCDTLGISTDVECVEMEVDKLKTFDNQNGFVVVIR